MRIMESQSITPASQHLSPSNSNKQLDEAMSTSSASGKKQNAKLTTHFVEKFVTSI